MANHLNWFNQNKPEANLQLYRSTSMIDISNLPPVLATLPGNATTYTDETATIGTGYYYVLRIEYQGSVIFSPIEYTESLLKLGPGPSSLLYGNHDLGYYGPVSAALLPAIHNEFSPTLSAAWITTFQKAGWHKFIRKGKIIYVAGAPVHSPASAGSFNAVTSTDFRKVFAPDSGIDWNFTDFTGWSRPIPASRRRFNGDSFLVRLPRGLPDDWNGTEVDVGVLALRPDTEFNEIVMPLMAGTWMEHKFGSVVKYSLDYRWRGITCAEQNNQARSFTRLSNPTTSSSSPGNYPTFSPTMYELAEFQVMPASAATTIASFALPMLELE